MTLERWQTFSFAQQLGHIGSEITRARVWEEKANKTSSQLALERALNLLGLTIADARWSTRLNELTRLREVVSDNYFSQKEYEVGLVELEQYCTSFSLAPNN